MRLPAPAAPWSMPPPWWHAWRRDWLTGDLTAGLVIAVMLVPQSLAYAMLAGLPPQTGLLASLLPLLAYALFGSSRSMSVGPAAITSLMLAQALAPLAEPGSARYAAMAAIVALGSGLVMGLLGLGRMGFLSQLLSRPVVQGFTVASAVLILAGQVAPLLGWPPLGHTLPEMLSATARLVSSIDGLHAADALLGVVSVVLLWGARPAWLKVGHWLGWRESVVHIAIRLWPMVVLLLAALAAAWMQRQPGWAPALVGAVSMDGGAWSGLWNGALPAEPQAQAGLIMPILMIALVGFVSSVSLAQTFAIRHGERIDADRELLGLGLANVGGAVLGGMPVAGGLSRSVVNEAAGARSPLAGVFSAMLLAVVLLTMLPWMARLPKATLAAVIIVGVSSLIELRSLRAAWRYDRHEAWAFVSTALGVLLIGFEAGILLGMAWSMGVMIWRHSQPHLAEVGRLPGTQHFRNVERYQAETLPGVLMVRIDESLDFTNIQRVEQRLGELMVSGGHAAGEREPVHHVVLVLTAVNHVDHTAAEALLELDKALAEQHKRLYLCEIKGPVIDRLTAGGIAEAFEGRMFVSAQHAWDALV